MLQNNSTLKSLIDKLWQNFWEGGIANPLTAIEQITYLIFMKRLDDLEAKRERDADFTGEKYTSRFKGKFKVTGSNEEVDKNELRWSVFKHKPADEMLLHVQTKVFPFLKEFNIQKTVPLISKGDERSGGGDSFTKHMANAVFIMPKASLLVTAINIVEDIFKEIEKDATEGGHAFQDIQGDVYEMLLSEIASAGKNGQFRTPRHIIKLMAELVAPQLGQHIADPACGTGGFLLGAYQYVLTDIVRKNKTTPSPSLKKGGELIEVTPSLKKGGELIEVTPSLKEGGEFIEKDEDGFERATMSAALTEKVKNILDKSFTGYDIDTTMVRLGLMNMMMHGIDEPQIDYKDTLSKTYNEDSRFDVVMANPPFTGNIDKGDINEGLKLPTTKTELLFVERIFTMLKMGGTAAVIVPSGVIQNSGKAFEALRKMLIEKTELKAVIAMPSGVFKPYAGVSTAILFFTKGGETTDVWFYDMQADGYTLDDKRNKIAASDLPDIIQRYKTYKSSPPSLKEGSGVVADSTSFKEGAGGGNDRKQKFFFVPKKEIVTNNYDLNLSTYKEEVYEEVKYENPKVIFGKLETIEENIQSGLEELKSMSLL